MVNRLMNGFFRQLRRAALRHDTEMTDGQLLERFRSAREESAFEGLLRRHGPMVLGVCRRVLGSGHDAEDAFQATFLVLVRKAAAVASRESVGSFLYGVAYRTAQKARVAAARRRVKERHMARPEVCPEHDDVWRELRPVIDEELSRLPEIYREPIVLCDIEGQTRKEAAHRLGCPEGTVSGRLSRARTMLARRLTKRGVVLTAAVTAAALARNAATACVPAPLTGTTTQVAALVAAGRAVGGAASASVAALTEGVLKSMITSKAKLGLALAAAVGLLAAGWGVYQTQAAPDPAQNNGPAGGGGAPAGDDKLNLPTGPGPIQVLASIDKAGKLVIKTATPVFRAPPGGGAGFGAPGAGPGGLGGRAPLGVGQLAWELRSETYDLDDVEVLDTKAKKVAKKDVEKLLKDEVVGLAVVGQAVDPLHLRVIKDGTLVFSLPTPRNIIPGGGVAPPGGGFGLPGGVVPPVGPGGLGGAAPGAPGSGTVPVRP